MIHRWLVLAAVTLAAPAAFADRAVTGSVVDDATGSPVAGALVSVGSGEAATDDQGQFRIDGVAFGRVDVVVIADGYRAYFGSARIGAVLAIRLEAAGGASEVIRVSGRPPSGPPLHLDTAAVRTQPGAGNDVLRALQSLPGVARTPFGLGGLALRGTAPRDTKVYLDDIEVPLLDHFGGIASFLPTAAVDEVTLEPGGASVRYGRGLGGVAIVTSRTGRGDDWRVGGEISLISAGALAEGPGPLKGSWLVGVRRSYFDALIGAAGVDLVLVPRYGDAQLRWESGDGRWMAILFGSDDLLTLVNDPGAGSGLGFNTTNLKSLRYTSRFARLGVRYRAVSGATSFEVLPRAGRHRPRVRRRADRAAQRRRVDRVDRLHLRAVVPDQPDAGRRRAALRARSAAFAHPRRHHRARPLAAGRAVSLRDRQSLHPGRRRVPEVRLQRRLGRGRRPDPVRAAAELRPARRPGRSRMAPAVGHLGQDEPLHRHPERREPS